MKRSQWFEALLFAEEMHQKGYVHEQHLDFGNLHASWIRWKKDNTIYSLPLFGRYAKEGIRGTLDYQEHLKRLEEFK